MSISTRRGDDGTTSLLFGRRVPKTHPRVEAYGTVDELTSALGLGRAHLAGDDPLRAEIEDIQRALIALSAELACADEDQGRLDSGKSKVLGEADLEKLDRIVAREEGEGLKFKGFILPGNTPASAGLDLARSIARRAERKTLIVRESGGRVREVALRYLNRLSDCLWLLARRAEKAAPPSGE